MLKLTYFYPKRDKVSFNFIAKKHIEILRNAGFEVIEADTRPFELDKLTDIAVIHPVFYSILGNNPKAFRKIVKRTQVLLGFDVADSDRIAQPARVIAHFFDKIFVPTTFAKIVYKTSGIEHVDVIPHGIEEEFLREPREPKNEDIKFIRELKGFKVLFFLWHSGHRKACDIVAEAMLRVMRERDNVHFIVKTGEFVDVLTLLLFNIPNTYILKGWLSREDLVDLYDSVDLVLVPSRGGGFELNALEALARRKPVIVSEWGAFNDYCSKCIKPRSRGRIKAFMMNPIEQLIHDGYWVDPDPVDLAEKILYVIDNYDQVMKHYEPIFQEVRTKFTWKAIAPILVEKVKKVIEETIIRNNDEKRKG